MPRPLDDLRLGVRRLRLAPAFAATTVATLALGIGLATAVLTVANALLLRPLPVVDQDRLVVVAGRTPDGRIDNYPLDLAGARDFARRSRALARTAFVGYFGSAPRTFRDGGQVTRLRYAIVSGDFFATLGARPLIGRALGPDDDREGAAPVVVVSHRLWQTRFGGAPDVVGRALVGHDDGVTRTVVGVMPAGLDLPRGTDVWMPALGTYPAATLSLIGLNVVGRLAPGVTANAAADEMTAYYRRPDAPPQQRDLRGVARTVPSLVVGDTRPAVLAFLGAAALLLLITCVNVANLLLVRGLARARELAVRAALGAPRRRLVAQLVAEHLALAAAGGVVGVAVAAAAVRLFVAFAPAALPRLDEVRLDGPALAAALLVTLAATLLFGVVPALLAARADAADTLRAGTRGSDGRGARRAAEWLVGGQVALAVLVLSAAALIGRSLVRLQRADLAFDGAPLLVAELSLPAAGYDTPAKQLALMDRVLAAVRATPGVRGASPVVAPPFAVAAWDGAPTAEGQTPEQAASNPMLNMDVVAPDYFAALGIPVVRGRGFTAADRPGAPPVVVLSESAARGYWPGADPLGKRLRLGRGAPLTVVGVVPDTRWRDLRAPRPSVYFPVAQSTFPFAPTTLVVRSAGASPASLAPALRRATAEVAPDVALASAEPFDALRAAPLAQPRLNAALLAVFAAAAVALAAVGVFGVLATAVRRRSRELAVRLALGATARDVGRLVLARGLAITSLGTAAGLAAALVANRALSSLLYEVTPTDPTTLAAVALALLGISAVASAFPARAAAATDPMATLRGE